MAIVVRRVQAGDETAFHEIAPDVFDEPVTADRLHAYLRTPGHMMVVACDGTTIVGQCTGVLHRHPDKPAELYVDEVGTAATHRRMGIARQMLEALFAWGRELGCTEAWLGTDLDNEAAQALYRRLHPSEDAAIRTFVFAL